MHVYADKTTKRLMRRGVLSISTRHKDTEEKKFEKHVPFSVPQAIGLALVISILLYWLPIFGPIIAGYVCGRRAGTSIKGAACGLVAGIILAIIGYILVFNVFSIGSALYACQNTLWTWISNANPLFASYCVLVSDWANIIGQIFRSFLITEPGNLVLLVVFGYVGGAIAAQRFRESNADVEKPVKHNWSLFNRKEKYEPNRYYYIKPDASYAHEYTSESSRAYHGDAAFRAEPDVNHRIRKPVARKAQTHENASIEEKNAATSSAYHAFSDDELYILGKAGAHTNNNRSSEADADNSDEAVRARLNRQRAAKNLVERALKTRNSAISEDTPVRASIETL